MGRDVPDIEFGREDRTRYRHKVRRCLDAFAQMLRDSRFDGAEPTVGLELELNLVDDDGDPAMANDAVLTAIADPAWQTELARFNIEVNIPPTGLAGAAFTGFEDEVRTILNVADQKARTVGSRMVMIGILPTLQQKHTVGEAISANPRYALLNQAILAARGEDIHLDITGTERLDTTTDSILPEAACTSAQLHMQVCPDAFPRYWNASEAIAGVQLALGANSPYLFGRQLWRETRIPLFEQTTDTRPEEHKAQGVRPRVWFGERWITSVFDLFEENTRYFPTLLPLCDEEDPLEVLEAGGVPTLGELTLHNGTVWRWNRPVYAVADQVPHLRVENRVLPAGPTVIDVLANAAFYFGLVRMLAEDEHPVWTRMSFQAAQENFREGARHGIDARLYWPSAGEVPATELALRRLLPMAHDGLDRWGVSPSARDRLLGVIEARCLTRRTGAEWQIAACDHFATAGEDRPSALRRMMLQYTAHMNANEPVHTWPLPA